MPAEPAAAPGASGASQSTANGAVTLRDNPNADPPSERLQVPIGDRTSELDTLEELGVPQEVRELVRQSQEKEAKEQKQQQQPEPPPAPSPAPPPAASHEEDKVDDTWPESARQRVGKLTAKREELKTQLSEKDAEIARLKAAQPAQTGQQPPTPGSGVPGQPGQPTPPPATPAREPDPTLPEVVARLTTEEEIQQRQQLAQHYHQWAMAHSEVDDDGVVRWKGEYDVPMGVDKDGNVVKKSYTPKEIAEVARNTAAELGVHLPRRLQQLQAERTAESQRHQAEELRPKYEELALEEYPDLADPKSELSQQVAAALKLEPFKSAPDGRLAAADLLSKTLARRDRLVKAGLIQAPAGNGAAPAATVDPQLAPFLAPKPPRAPAVPATVHSAPPPPSTDAEATKIRQDYLNSPRTEEDYQVFVDQLSENEARKRGSTGNAPARV